MLGAGADFESLNVETPKRLHKCSEILRKRDLRVGDKKLNAISPTNGPEQVISITIAVEAEGQSVWPTLLQSFKVSNLDMLKGIMLGMQGIPQSSETGS